MPDIVESTLMIDVPSHTLSLPSLFFALESMRSSFLA